MQITKTNQPDILVQVDPSEFASKSAPGAVSKKISSAQLFAGARELVIEHKGAAYRLRLTNQGKLILTK